VTELLPPEVHPQALLLPWYLSGTLSPSERDEVAAHLRGCENCAAELAALTRDRRLVRDLLSDAERAPMRDLHRETLKRIGLAGAALDAPTSTQPASRAPAPALIYNRWRVATALAASLVLVQLAVIVHLSRSPTPESPVETRSLGPTTTRLRLLVNPGAREATLFELLRALPARVVDGPDADGAYLVEVPTADSARIAQILARARANPELIREASVASP
jgi:hypothetical protein